MIRPRWRRRLAAGLAFATLGIGTLAAGPSAVPVGAQNDGQQAPAQPTTSLETTTTQEATTTSPSTSSTSPPSSTSSTEPSPSTTEPVTTTTEAEPVEEEQEPTAPPSTDEVPVEEETTTSTRRAATTTTTGTTRGPQSSVVAPTSTTAPDTGSGSSREQRVVWLVVGLLCVVGLLIGTLTWRYWWFTNPRRGYARSRAIMSHRQLRDDADSEVVAVWEDGQAIEPPDVPVPGSPVVRDPDTLPTGMRAIRPPAERKPGE